MTEQTMKQKFVNWLKELWGKDEIMMRRMPDKELNFKLGEKRGR